MNAARDFFRSLREDLLGRRLLPFLLVLGVALVAAVAYAVLGSASSSTGTVAISSSTGSVVAGVPVSQAPASPTQAISETTNGTSKQHKGSAHDPFTPLPGAKQPASASSKSTATSTSSSSTPASGPQSSSTVVPVPTTPATPAPAKPKKVYVHFHVSAQLGVVPVVAEGAPPQPAQLKTYADMSLDEPLPGKDNPQLVYLGVVVPAGKAAVFGLTGEAILHGSATCKPSPTQCQAIELQVGHGETLEVLEADGSTVTYELKLVSIDKSVSSASTASVHSAFHVQSKAARRLAHRMSKLSELRYSRKTAGLCWQATRPLPAVLRSPAPTPHAPPGAERR